MSGVVCGGVGQAKEATPEVQEMVLKVKEAIEEKAGTTYEVFEAKQYATQVVAGTNYFVKVHVGGGDHVHVRIFRSLQSELNVHSVQVGKSEAEPLKHF